MDITAPNQPTDFLAKIGSDQPFRIVESHVYAKIGGNDSLLPSPAVVHFGGYSLNEVHVQKISILNTSDVSQRLHVVNTTTPFFRVRYEKKGRVAPGMSEDLYIEFKPNAWRYYYDCVRIHCEDENLLIPIHAYPVLNEVVFPQVLDFGAHALCDVRTKIVDIECKVPIQFEYEITVTRPHADFTVTPLRGLIPANGKARVEITYSPVKLGTATMELSVDVSQFNFIPIKCVVTGNAAPGIVRNRILAQINETHRAAELENQRDGTTGPALVTTTGVPEIDIAIDETLKMSRKAFTKGLPLETYDRSVEIPWHGVGSGAPMDAGGAYLANKEREAYRERTRRKAEEETLRRENASLSTSSLGRVEEEDYDIVRGLRVPKDLTNMTAVNYLLTQEVGKLKPGDLKVAIAQQRVAKERRRLEQETMKTGSADQAGSADSIIADELASLRAGGGKRQLKEMVFLQGLREIDESETQREFQAQRQHVGSPLLQEHDLERIQLARVESARARRAIERSNDRERYGTIARGAQLEGVERGRAETLSFTLSTPSHTPTFDVYQNDVWTMRRHALQKFQNAGNIVVVRLRCGRRLALIQRFLKQALGDNCTRAQVKSLVQRDNRLAAAGVILSRQLNEQNEQEGEEGGAEGGSSSGGGSSSDGGSSGVVVLPAMDLPCARRIAGGGGGGGGGGGSSDNMRDPVDVDVPIGFDHLRPALLRLPKEAGLFNHVPLPLPKIRLYAPIEITRKMRTGAQEEESIRVQAKIPHQMIADAISNKVTKDGKDSSNSKDGSNKDGSHREDGAAASAAGTSDNNQVDDENSEMEVGGKSNNKMKSRSSCMVLPVGASKCWSEPCHVSREELLLPNPSVRPFLPPTRFTEADPEYYLQPKRVEFDAPNTRRRKLIHGIGACSLGSMEGVSTLSSIYQETLERPFTSSERHRDHEAVWSGATVPDFLDGPEEDDMMSDTDSDEEEEVDTEVSWPTVADSVNAFRSEEDAAAAAAAAVKTGDGESDSGGERRRRGGGRRRIVILARDRTQMLLGKRRALARFPRSTAVTKYLRDVDEAVVFPKHKLGF